jgi:hypothetical protein
MLAELHATGARHLVAVRYGPKHNPGREWVYNDADIDGAQVIWAREMDQSQNRKLLAYFTSRQVWLLEVNDLESPLKLVPYSVRSGS